MQSYLDSTIPLKRVSIPEAEEELQKPKRTRGRSGCLNCRRRRKKCCDEVKPRCTKCQTRGEDCEWDTGITFRLTGLDAQHPSMLQSRTSRPGSHNSLKIVDVRFNQESRAGEDDHQPQGEARNAPRKTLPDPLDPDEADEADGADGARDQDTINNGCQISDPSKQDALLCTIPEESTSCEASTKASCESGARPKCQAFPYDHANPVDLVVKETCPPTGGEGFFDIDVQMNDSTRSNSDGSTGGSSSLWSQEVSISSVSSTSSRQSKGQISSRHESQGFEDGLTHLDTLDFLVSENPSSTSAGSMENGMSPEIPFERLVEAGPAPSLGFHSQSQRDEPRRKLSRHLCEIVDKVSANHFAASHDAADGAAALQELHLNRNNNRSKGIRLLHQPLTARPLGCTKLVKRRQLELWRNYIREVAPALDVCGSKGYFRHSIPLLAKPSDHLHYAILALSARHIELREHRSTRSESSGLYQDALNLAIAELHTLETNVVATCILLCIMEMMNPPSETSTVMQKTCTRFLEAADFNARSGGLQQALFWSFAGFTVWTGYADQGLPALSVRQFYPTDCLSTAVSYIRSLTWGEGYAKYAVFLTSTVLNVMQEADPTSTPERRDARKSRADSIARWQALYELVEDWFNCRPEEMQPLMAYPSILDDYRHPFPMVLYGSTSSIVGNLLYHAASIVLLLHQPSSNEIALPKSQKSTLWHARQICGIVAENSDKAASVSAIHPLRIAGKVISNNMERKKIMEMMACIEQETGWSTAWAVDDLMLRWSRPEQGALI